jgi:hypothetical protein
MGTPNTKSSKVGATDCPKRARTAFDIPNIKIEARKRSLYPVSFTSGGGNSAGADEESV